jgi:hypothetical protein
MSKPSFLHATSSANVGRDAVITRHLRSSHARTFASLFAFLAACSADSNEPTTHRGPEAAAGSTAPGTAGSIAVGQAGAAAVGGRSVGPIGAAGRMSNDGAAGSGGRMRGGGGRGANAGSGGTSSGMAGAAAVAGAGSAAGAGGSRGPDSNILVPAQGVLLGHYYGDGTVAETDARIGRKPALHLVYYAWEDDWPSAAKKDFAAGKTPLVNWEPGGIDFNDIVSGKLDDTIKKRASGSKDIGQKFFLDFAAEMNGDEAWGGNNAPLYVSAYRHIHDLFIAAGATNVVWAWCPNVTDVSGGNKNTLDYYPGDDYVDWTGVDGYNWGAGSGFQWQSFQNVFSRIYPILATKNKPILIGEMASDENGGDKAAWIDAMIPALRADFPMVKGLVWFDVHKERHWEINSSPATLAAYTRFATDPFMNP